ncbi:MAG TPA: acetate/propionate family kinase [Thermoanaerobaculia bacterium]|nr:acetate/propionate family kinase [Thermoanaerobaculia bacterium]
MKRLLVLNTGSSSLKWSVLERAGERSLAAGTVAWDSLDPRRRAEQIAEALRAALPAAESRNGAGNEGGGADGAAHRVVHGGAAFRGAVRIDAEVRERLARLVEIDPLHTPAALAGIDAVSAAFPALPQFAAFDTSFHATLPEAAARYALPWEWSERWGLRRYGFHGLSVAYASRRARELLGGAPARLVVCHLGSGCSASAVAGGRSLDTSMGFTPLEGVMMASRSGSVDPGLLLHLLARCGLGVEELAGGLNERAGLLGVSGISADLREVLAAAGAGSARAATAYAMFTHSVLRTTGAMIAVLGGLDALVFTGGIGEHSARLRADVAARLGFAGLELDPRANEQASGDVEVSNRRSTVRVLTITAREDLAVLAEVAKLLDESGV